MQETQVKELLKKYGLLNLYKINTADFTKRLNAKDIDLEQYIHYFMTEVGPQASIASTDSLTKYTDARSLEENTLLKHIYNAYLTFEKLNTNLANPTLAVDVLKEMVEPHLLYFMLSAANTPREAAKYREDAKLYYDSFKSAVTKLPQEFDTCKEDLARDSIGSS